jgi:hypothetical protein
MTFTTVGVCKIVKAHFHERFYPFLGFYSLVNLFGKFEKLLVMHVVEDSIGA